MRKGMWRFVVAASFAAMTKTALSADFPPCRTVNPDQVQAFYSGLTPGISWAAWSELLGKRWTRTAIVEGSRFDEAGVARAIAGIGPEPVGGSYVDDYENYQPPSGVGTSQQETAYRTAASLYRQSNWSSSIPEFDAVVADKDSPYRAAAAYTAARAALKAGDIRGGIGRIARIVSDPSLQEYRLAAHHLLGTMSYLTGNPQIVAARYAEIENLLIAPPEVVCHDAELQRLMGEANQGLRWYLNLAFPRDAFHFGYSGSLTTRAVLDKLADDDPVLDLVRVLAAPTPFTLAWDWAGGQRRLEAAAQRRDWRTDDPFAYAAFAASDAPALTAHARERWLATRQVLWGYALAQRTSELADAGLIRGMREALGSLPETPAVRSALPVFHWHLVRHEIRILLMHNRIDEAIALLRRDLPKYGTSPLNVPYYYAYYSATDAQSIIDGGVRALLERFDLDGARRWAGEAKARYLQPSEELRVLLATGFDDPTLKEVKSANSLRAVVDLLPARRMTAIATSTPNLASDQRRAFLAAGWLRIYMLGDWEQSKALLPQLREAFPELATDIDNIRDSWFDTTRRRLVVRMLLRTPGLTHSSTWIGTRTGYRARDMFVIDSHNPNDGNWWCPLDVDQVKRTLAESFFAEPLHLGDYLPLGYYWQERSVATNYQTAEEDRRKSLVELADKLIAWHPLLKEVDLAELGELSKVRSGPRLLSEAAVQWAKSSNFLTRWFGRDRLLPETLHLAVRSTRYGCRRAGGHAEYSRAAFVQLHQLFPESEWTRKTPYWFDRP
jgi:hypothetical protein